MQRHTTSKAVQEC